MGNDLSDDGTADTRDDPDAVSQLSELADDIPVDRGGDVAATEPSLRTLSALGVLIVSATASLAVDVLSRTLTVLDGVKAADGRDVCSLTGDKDEAGDTVGPDVSAGEKLAALLPLDALVSTLTVLAAVLPELSANEELAGDASVDALDAFVT